MNAEQCRKLKLMKVCINDIIRKRNSIKRKIAPDIEQYEYLKMKQNALKVVRDKYKEQTDVERVYWEREDNSL